MNDTILSFKKELLQKLEDERARIESTREVLVSNIFADKKADVDKLGKELDDNLIKYVQEKQAQFNADVERMKAKISAKKDELNVKAKSEAEAEADLQLSGKIADFDKEIAQLKSEIAK